MPKSCKNPTAEISQKSVEDLVDELFRSSEDELLIPVIPFDKVIFLKQLPDDFNKDSRAAHDKFKRLEGKAIPLFHQEDLVRVRRNLAQDFPYAISIIDNLLKPTFRRISSGKKGLIFEPSILVGLPQKLIGKG